MKQEDPGTRSSSDCRNALFHSPHLINLIENVSKTVRDSQLGAGTSWVRPRYKFRVSKKGGSRRSLPLLLSPEFASFLL